jgi:hypothetical protein
VQFGQATKRQRNSLEGFEEFRERRAEDMGMSIYSFGTQKQTLNLMITVFEFQKGGRERADMCKRRFNFE